MPKIGGLLQTDYQNNNWNSKLKSPASTAYVGQYRYSGNDITKENLASLKEYIAGKYALIVDSKFYNKDSDGIPISVNSSYIDNTSYMYDFLESCMNTDNTAIASVNRNADGTSIRGTDGIAVTLNKKPTFYYYVNMPKLSLSVNNSSADSVNSLTTLTWDLDLSSKTEIDLDTYYAVHLYFDLNADGKYSTKEEMTDITVMQKQTDGSYSVVDKSANGMYLLKTGTYRITRILVGDYVGELPWKIEATQSSPVNDNIRASQNGYLKIKVGNAPTVKILQIMQKGSDGNWNMQKDTSFQTLLSSVADYSIKITSIRSNDFVSQFNTNASAPVPVNILDDYDMLILGFADVYQDISNTVVTGNKLKIGPVTAIENFINDGKSVLFTHDTTSFINVATSDQYKTDNTGTYKTYWHDGVQYYCSDTDGMAAYWGYNINTIMRNIVGMDRYGITGVNTDGSLNATAKLLREGNNLTLSQGTGGLTSKNAAGNTVQLTGNDFAYKANDAESTYSTTQGYTNAVLNMSKLYSTEQYNLNPKKAAGLDTDIRGNGAFSKMYATKINTGLITQYPFAISDKLSIASTHFQYYQLDLQADDDHDGESDIVVWYTIGGSDSTSNTLYTASPKDVRNNYYIYSKGNVMYSGVGHSTVSGNSEEAKLFINTIVAAYKNGVQSPIVTSLKTPSLAAAVENTKYLTYDQAMASSGAASSSGNMDGNVELYYSVFDSNMATSSKNMTVTYYKKDDVNGDGTIINGVKLTEITGLTTYVGASNTEVSESNPISSGSVYHATLTNPYNYVSDSSNAEIYIVVRNSFTYYGKTYTDLLGYTKVTLMKTQLFDLD